MLYELDRQRYLNEVYIKEKIILVKLLDLKKNIYHSNPIHKPIYNLQLNNIVNKLIVYDKQLSIFKLKNNCF